MPITLGTFFRDMFKFSQLQNTDVCIFKYQ